MEDRHLFKAKSEINKYFKNKSSWFTGYLISQYLLLQDDDSVDDAINIIPETICQCTGLRDKNNNLIFVNDKVLFIDYGRGKEYIGTIEIKKSGLFVIAIRENGNFYSYPLLQIVETSSVRIEVIGNIFDEEEETAV